MITVPPGFLTQAGGTHAPLWRVRMLTAAGTQIGDVLPFVGGSLTKTQDSVTPRTRGSVVVPTQLAATLLDQNYLPTGQRLVFEYRLGTAGWVRVADLDMVSSEISRPDSMWQLEAADRSIRVALDDTDRGGWVEPTGTISAAIQYIVNRTFPGTSFSITGPATTQLIPPKAVKQGDPWNAASGLATLAQSEVFFRAHDRVCVVRPLPVLAGAGVDTLAVGAAGNVTGYTLAHEMGFNTTVLVYENAPTNFRRVGVWVDTRSTSPVAVQRIGSHVVYREDRDADASPTQAEADAAAAALGRRVAGRSRSPTIRHVTRPWLEPGDTINVTYAGGPTELQLVESISIPLDNTNIQVTTCRSSEYQMGVPV